MFRVQAVAALSLLAMSLQQSAHAEESPADATRPTIGRMTPGYTYYNRPGASLEQHGGDVSSCVSEAARVRTVDEMTMGPGGLLGAAVMAGLSNAFHAGSVGAALENCMVAKRWRVVRLPEAEGVAIAAMSKEQASEALKPWIGAADPHGEIVRSWNNEAGRGATIRIIMRPGYTDDGILSLKAVTGQNLRQIPYGDGRALERGKVAEGWSTRRIKPESFQARPSGSAVLIANVKGAGRQSGISIVFERVGSDPSVAPSMSDHLPDKVDFMGSFLKDGEWFAYAIPAGTWRISRISSFPYVTLCYGSPAIEVKAGEVVYAGSFDLKAEQLGPDLSLERVQTYLTKHGAATDVRPASYTNGWTGKCEGNQFYALEVEGAPSRAPAP